MRRFVLPQIRDRINEIERRYEAATDDTSKVVGASFASGARDRHRRLSAWLREGELKMSKDRAASYRGRDEATPCDDGGCRSDRGRDQWTALPRPLDRRRQDDRAVTGSQ